MPNRPIHTITDDQRAAIIRARLAPTMAEAVAIYCAALASVPAVRAGVR